MGVLGEWNGHQFVVSENLIRSFKDLTVKGGVDTDVQKNAVDSYTKVKNAQPYKVTMTVMLNALTGADVRTEAMTFVQEAGRGATNYLTVGGERLVSSQVMLTQCEISNIEMTAKGVWVQCEAKLTFEQGSGAAQASGGSGGGTKTTTAQKAATVKNAVETVKTGLKVTVSNAANAIKNKTTVTTAAAAKATSVRVATTIAQKTAQKAATVKSGGGTAGKLVKKAVK